MGYSHGYTLREHADPRFAEITRDVNDIITASEIPMGDANGNPGSQPQLGPELIRLNGIQPQHCETFLYPAPSGWEYCKTGYQPYDVIVCATLMAMKHHLQENVAISSDGNLDGPEWQAAYRLYRRALRRPPPEFFQQHEQTPSPNRPGG